MSSAQTSWPSLSSSLPSSSHLQHDPNTIAASSPNAIPPHHSRNLQPAFQASPVSRTNTLSDMIPPSGLPSPPHPNSDYISGVPHLPPSVESRSGHLPDSGILTHPRVADDDDDDERRVDTRRGKERVQRRCFNCGHLNHIRKNNCDKCEVPKPPAKKRTKRQRRKKRTSSIMPHAASATFGQSGIPSHFAQTHGHNFASQPQPHHLMHQPHHTPQYMPPISASVQHLPELSGSHALSLPHVQLQEQSRPDINRRQVPDFPPLGFEAGGFSLMGTGHATHSFGQGGGGPSSTQTDDQAAVALAGLPQASDVHGVSQGIGVGPIDTQGGASLAQELQDRRLQRHHVSALGHIGIQSSGQAHIPVHSQTQIHALQPQVGQTHMNIGSDDQRGVHGLGPTSLGHHSDQDRISGQTHHSGRLSQIPVSTGGITPVTSMGDGVGMERGGGRHR